MKKVLLNETGHSQIFAELEDLGLVKFKNGNMSGVKGLSMKPRWDGYWSGFYYSNSSIYVTEKGLEILENLRNKRFEIL